MKKLLIILITFFTISVIFCKSASATTCSFPFNASSGVTIASPCGTVNSTTDGVDNGSGTTNNAILTVNNTTFTVNQNSTVGYGQIHLTGASPIIWIDQTGQFKAKLQKGPLYLGLLDADGDTHPGTGGLTQTATTNGQSAPSGAVRKYTLTNNDVTVAGYSSILDSGGYRTVTFTSSGGSISAPNGATVQVLVVGGGGGGGSSTSGNGGGGGGGAGGVIYNGAYAVSGTISNITIGTHGNGGGSSAGQNGGTGNSSVFGTITAAGGGGGGNGTGANANAGLAGGSGGGAGWNSYYYDTVGAASPAGQGNAGGQNGSNNAGAGSAGAGGGGGCSTAGFTNTALHYGSNGGKGCYESITGLYYGGGGGGGGSGTTGGTGGVGGGGSTNGGPGAANTGGGGAGAYANNQAAGNGGDGVVVVRYPYYVAPNASVAYSGASSTFDSGGYRTVTFASTVNGTVTVSGAGSATVDMLIVGGGGGGGTNFGGGGGGGGVVYQTGVTLSAGTYNVTVGAGGAGGITASGGGPAAAGKGGDSIFDAITATGGGGGASGSTDYVAGGVKNGGTGGGGAGYNVTANPAGSGTGGQGYNGGVGFGASGNVLGTGGGGGGAGQAGGAGVSGTAGKGGDGASNSITGSAVYYGGGGGGGAYQANSAGAPGNGGGGSGINGVTDSGWPGTDGYGGGGGGGSGGGGAGGFGGKGGSGVVIIHYSIPAASDCNDANPTIWQNLTGYTDADSDGYTIGSGQVCSGATLPAGYVGTSNGTDCNDSNSGPCAPTNLTVTNNGISELDLSWTAPATSGNPSGPAATGYNIYRCTGTYCPPGSSIYASTGSTSYIDSGLPSNTFGYRVIATNNSGANLSASSTTQYGTTGCTNRTVLTDADHDGYTTGSSGVQCTVDSTSINGRTYYSTDGSTYPWLLTAASLGTDCNDGNATVFASATCYADGDNDNYGTGTAYTCMNNATCVSATLGAVGTGTPVSANFASGNTDCCDSDANSYPGESLYYSSKNGCGSWDRDCSGAVNKCISGCASGKIVGSVTNGSIWGQGTNCAQSAGSCYYASTGSWVAISSGTCGATYSYIPSSPALYSAAPSCQNVYCRSGTSLLYCK